MNFPSKGDVVLIPKGTRIHDCRTGEYRTAKRDYPVKVHRVERAWVTTPHMAIDDDHIRSLAEANGTNVEELEEKYSRDPVLYYSARVVEVYPDHVIWAGSGGYWQKAKLADIMV